MVVGASGRVHGGTRNPSGPVCLLDRSGTLGRGGRVLLCRIHGRIGLLAAKSEDQKIKQLVAKLTGDKKLSKLG